LIPLPVVLGGIAVILTLAFFAIRAFLRNPVAVSKGLALGLLEGLIGGALDSIGVGGGHVALECSTKVSEADRHGRPRGRDPRGDAWHDRHDPRGDLAPVPRFPREDGRTPREEPEDDRPPGAQRRPDPRGPRAPQVPRVGRCGGSRAPRTGFLQGGRRFHLRAFPEGRLHGRPEARDRDGGAGACGALPEAGGRVESRNPVPRKFFTVVVV